MRHESDSPGVTRAAFWFIAIMLSMPPLATAWIERDAEKNVAWFLHAVNASGAGMLTLGFLWACLVVFLRRRFHTAERGTDFEEDVMNHATAILFMHLTMLFYGVIVVLALLFIFDDRDVIKPVLIGSQVVALFVVGKLLITDRDSDGSPLPKQTGANKALHPNSGPPRN